MPHKELNSIIHRIERLPFKLLSWKGFDSYKIYFLERSFLNLDFTLFVGGWDGWNGTEIKKVLYFFSCYLRYNIKH